MKPLELICLGFCIGNHDGIIACRQRRWFARFPFVHTHNSRVAGLNATDPRGVGFNQAAFHIGNGIYRAAHAVDLLQFSARSVFQRIHFAFDCRVFVE